KNSARVALGFEGGAPAIVEQPFGKGQVILVATDGSLSSVDPVSKTPWTTMAAWPSFVPLVQEMLALTAGTALAAQNGLVGETLDDEVRWVATRQSLTMKLPTGREEPIRISTDEQGSRWAFSDTYYSGPYQVEQTGGSEADRL